MEIKLNLPLIGRISGIFSKSSEKPRDRGETSETSQNVADYYYQKVKLERTRMAKYADYRIMDEEYVECSSALDLYADNATKEKEKSGDAFEIMSEDPKAKNILDELVDRTKLQDTIWETSRNIAKMGDEFDEIVVDDNNLIMRLKNLEPETMAVDLDEYGVDKDEPFVQKSPGTDTRIAGFKRWQIIHWKNGGKKMRYGESILKSIRRVYKQLQMMEDGMVIGRLTRSHLRYKFLIDVEGMSAEDAEDYIRRVKESVKKKRLINPITGQLDTTQNPISAEEDIFLGVRKDSKGDVDVLQGATNLGNIRDVEYFQNKLFIGLRVSKSALGIEKDVEAKATAIERDIQFMRAVGRNRKGLRVGLSQPFNLQLILAGMIPRKDLYEIHFAQISMVDEMRRYTMEKLKAEIAKIYYVDMGLLNDEYIYKHFVGVPDDEIEALLAKQEPGKLAIPKSASKGNGNLALRASGSTGLVSPGATAMVAKRVAAENLNRVGDNGFHIATLQMMNLVETLRDLVGLELNR